MFSNDDNEEDELISNDESNGLTSDTFEQSFSIHGCIE